MNSIFRHSSSSPRSTAAIITLLKACKTIHHLYQVHASIIQRGDMFVGTCLVDMYEKCGKIDDARKVFDGMSEKNVGDIMEAKRLFDEMPQKNVMEDLGNVRVVLDAMPEKSVTFFTIMIDGYAKAGDMATSRFLFDQVPEKDVGDTYTYKVAASFEKSLQGFEHVYDDIVSGVIDVNELGFLVKHMECMEQTMNKFQNNQNEESRRVFEQELAWQRQDVRH
ncbi:Pentatricopeptide repeat-containing protein [Arachis hypogaea]|nr:Pentatricopeptide repeat-containing protein [Arachis hypogaea]